MAAIIHSSLAIVAVLCCFIGANSEAREFSISLIHRDSPISPLYNPHETPYQRLQKTLSRTINRINRHNNARLSVYSDLYTDLDGEYLMNISIGTPPFKILAIADTGSDIIWTQCSPNNSFLFNPALSSTYKTLPCQSRTCASWGREGAFCARNDGVCNYRARYVDTSHSIGDFAFETLTLDASAPGRTVSFQNTIIGCGNDSMLTYNTLGTGIVGLGGGPASLINQLGHSIGWRFSYCLPLRNGNKFKSTINFGQNVTGYGFVSTPMIYDPLQPYYFFLRLEAISVGDVRIPFRGSVDNDKDIVIDSGTTISVLPARFFSRLSSEVERQIVGRKKVADPFKFFSLCYKIDPAGPNAPPIKVHFLRADLELPMSNVFFKISNNVTCFAFRPTTDGNSFYGNVAQQNFLIGYDLKKKVVSFKRADCGHK